MKNLNEGLLDINIEENNNKISMNWTGECININPSTVLNPYFDTLIINLKPDKELVIDFARLQYMKSSTVPYIVKLITRLNKEKIKTTIYYNSL